MKEAAFLAGRIPPQARAMIRIGEVMRRTGKSRSTIWRDVKAKRFPAPVSTGPNSIAWYDDEVADWQDGLERVWAAPDEAA